MLDRRSIAALIPHQGAMCLLDQAVAWDAAHILCAATSHLDPANPLREAGRLGAVCGLEYGLQAAALHGALCGGAPQPRGFLAALRGISLHVPRLDDSAFGVLHIDAWSEGAGSAGLAYRFRIAAEGGKALVEGRGLIALGSGG